ncbi:MAG: hypothetical protein IT424_00535 [Pirellulales bacterium]|nr:hypothetical protein [Pirellulales bacterium]
MRRRFLSRRRNASNFFSASSANRRARRRLAAEPLEDRRLMAADDLLAADRAAGGHGRAHDHDSVYASYEFRGFVADRLVEDGAAGAAATRGPAGGTLAAATGDPVLAPATLAESLSPLSSIPVLNSLPGAPVTIYLDFNGHTSSGGGVTPVYDADGDATTFSDQELQFMGDLWRVTTEDFAPFNVNVTTVEPSVLAPGVPTSAANGKALRLAIGGTSADGYAGYAQYNSFTNSGENLAWVYAQGKTDAVTYGGIASHEAGHSFGLRHLEKVGDPDWRALMYSTLFNNRATWTTGINDQGVLQDSMAVITSSLNGITYRADDHAGSVAGATPLTAAGAGFVGAGVISSTSDADVFTIPATGQSLLITVEGDSPSQNLDAVLELLDSAGNVLARSNPGDSVNASLVADSTDPVYFAVRSEGQYGHIGQYTITVEASGPGVTVTAPKGPFTTSESGRSTSQTIVLNARPSADVVFNVASSNTSEGVLSAASVVFTPDNWFIPQTVTVTGVADGVTDGAAAYSVVFAPAESADPSYHGFDPADLNVVNLDDAPGQVYWLRAGLYDGVVAVQRSTLAGENVQTVLDIPSALGTSPTGSYGPTRIAIDPVGGKMYWGDPLAHGVYRANVDGSSPQLLVTGLANPTGVALDLLRGKLYWAEQTSKKIQRSNLDGSNVEDVFATGLNVPGSVAIDETAGKVYWNDVGNRTFSRANLDGTGVELLYASDGVANPLGTPQGLALHPASGKIYFGVFEAGGAKIYGSNLDGSQVEVLVDFKAVDPALANTNIQTIAIDHAGGRILWSQSVGRRVYSADLDGGNVAVVHEGTADLRGIAVLPALPGFTVTPTTGLVTTEAGGAANFTVALNAPPTVDVVITVATSDASEGTVSASSLTFTPANWNTPQTVTVAGVDDAVYDQDVAYTIVLGAATSADAAYNGLNPADVSAVNRDNDPSPTKFYVVNDATQNRTYEYGPTGAAVENYLLNSGNSAPRGAASSAAGDRTWVVDANRKVYVYNTSGGLVGSWTAGTIASNATVEGVATNGADVWIVDARADRVYRYAGAASSLSGTATAASSFALNSGNRNPKDIVTDGQYLWVVNDNSTDKVFKYTLAGQLVGSWTIDSANRSPTGITLDPASPSHLWVVDSGTDRVYQYNAAVGRTSGSQSASSSFALATGNTNPQGIADPPTTEAMLVQRLAPAHRDAFVLPLTLESLRPQLSRTAEREPAGGISSARRTVEPLTSYASSPKPAMGHRLAPADADSALDRSSGDDDLAFNWRTLSASKALDE